MCLSHPNGLGQIRFHWDEIRFDHVVELGSDAAACQEDQDGNAWPISPPLQQVSIEQINGRPCALAVGAAGTNHFSLSIQPTDDGFYFEWACRLKTSPQRLGTQYRPSELRFQPDDDSKVTHSKAHMRIEPKHLGADALTARWGYQVARAVSTRAK